MIRHLLIFIHLFLGMVAVGYASSEKVLCTMTFNSTDEREAFKKYLEPHGYKHIELTPYGKSPSWLNQSCESTPQCDILVLSGHFGGVFFGETSDATLSLAELLEHRKNKNCPGVLDRPKAVYLMGCNTLASNKKDHRSLDEYLKVLLKDGYPIELAEKVAAARYTQYGESVESLMKRVFPNAKALIGFESTGPLGAFNGPKIESALRASSSNDLDTMGLNLKAFSQEMRGTSLKIVKDFKTKSSELINQAESKNPRTSYQGWLEILKEENASSYLNYIVENYKNRFLVHALKRNNNARQRVHKLIEEQAKKVIGLPIVSYELLRFKRRMSYLGWADYKNEIVSLLNRTLENNITYISADQICSILKDNQVKVSLLDLSIKSQNSLESSSYRDLIQGCMGEAGTEPSDKIKACILNSEGDDIWDCLTENQTKIMPKHCKLAKKANSDIENGDDMLWYCYSKMKAQRRLNRAQCLELTQDFKILSSKLKMNWNCLNRIRD